MSNDSKFINEALSDIDDLVDNEDSVIRIKLNEQQIEMAAKLQNVLRLSKNVFLIRLLTMVHITVLKMTLMKRNFHLPWRV